LFIGHDSNKPPKEVVRIVEVPKEVIKEVPVEKIVEKRVEVPVPVVKEVPASIPPEYVEALNIRRKLIAAETVSRSGALRDVPTVSVEVDGIVNDVLFYNHLKTG
jgi:hypothetical protein